MIDPEETTARALVELYHQRWEVEVCYVELASTLLDGRVLRGRYPQAVEQEVWAVLVLYQAIWIAMADCVLTIDIPPLRLSFSVAVSAARDQVMPKRRVRIR